MASPTSSYFVSSLPNFLWVCSYCASGDLALFILVLTYIMPAPSANIDAINPAGLVRIDASPENEPPSNVKPVTAFPAAFAAPTVGALTTFMPLPTFSNGFTALPAVFPVLSTVFPNKPNALFALLNGLITNDANPPSNLNIPPKATKPAPVFTNVCPKSVVKKLTNFVKPSMVFFSASLSTILREKSSHADFRLLNLPSIDSI